MPLYKIKYADDADAHAWNDYVRSRPGASHYHLFGWRKVISGTYGHPTHYLMLLRKDEGNDASLQGVAKTKDSTYRIVGVLPLVHLKHAIFGNALVSLPFLDAGGILSDGTEADDALLSEVIELGRKIGAKRVELRQERILSAWMETESHPHKNPRVPTKMAMRHDKVRMLIDLPESSELLLKSFKSKLRSQIAKPLKSGLVSKEGGTDLLEDFYRVFLVNMRDLGSPVHSMELMRNVLDEFSDSSRIVVVYKSREAVAAAFLIGFEKTLRNPWASSLRKHASLSPNMLLYQRMLEFACDNGFRIFDFGRSTPGEGTFKFKEQWGAAPAPLFWHYLSLDGKDLGLERAESQKFRSAISCWKRLPLGVTRIIGPRIRRHISA
jgi:serine/alanine adding enzyme